MHQTDAQYQVNSIHSKEDDTFPIVSISDKKIEENINHYLHSTYLETVNVSSKNPFEKIIKKSESRTKYFHDFTVNKNTIPVLSLSFLTEYCGAYCEEYFEFANFDLSNGYVITIDDLIDQNSSKQLTQILNNKIRNEISDFIKKIPKINQINQQDIDYYNDQKEIYKDCLENIDLYQLSDNGFNYYISNDSIYFQRGRCSNHASRALDELGNFTYGFTKKEIEPFLSEYGKNLYGNQPRKMTDFKEKIFAGKIGKYPIKGVINQNNSGFYWYERFKQLIEIDFVYENQEIIINEKNYNNNTTATFKLKQINNQFIGSWKKTNTKENFPVEIHFNF